MVHTSPAVLREIYQDLTGDSAAVPSEVSKAVQSHLRLALDSGDPDLVYDLRHHNEGRRSQIDAFCLGLAAGASHAGCGLS